MPSRQKVRTLRWLQSEGGCRLRKEEMSRDTAKDIRKLMRRLN